MEVNKYDENDSRNAFKGMACLFLSCVFLFLLPILLLDMQMNTHDRKLYCILFISISIIFLIPSFIYRLDIQKLSNILRRKNAKIAFKRDMFFILFAIIFCIFFLFIAWTLFLKTTLEGWIYIGYPFYYEENKVMFLLGVFLWLFMFYVFHLNLIRLCRVFLYSVRNWNKLL